MHDRQTTRLGRTVRGGVLLAPVLLAAAVAQAADVQRRVGLDEATMDGLRAGVAYATSDLNAFALGETARALTDARTRILGRGVVQRGIGGGSASATGGEGATTQASGSSQLGALAIGVDGGAQSSGPGAFADTRLDTRVIDTPTYSMAVGRLRTVACCAPDSTTYASGSTLWDGLNGYGHFVGRGSEGPVLTRSEVYVMTVRYRLPVSGTP